MKRRLPAGDYAVEYSGTVVAAGERKSLDDLAGSLMLGKLTYALAELSVQPRAGFVVEDRHSALFKLKHVLGGQISEALAEAQARFSAVTIMFAETRPLAQEWIYRFLGAALAEHVSHVATAEPESTMAVAGPIPAALPTTSEIRAWAKERGLTVPDRGRIPAFLLGAHRQSRAGTPNRHQPLRPEHFHAARCAVRTSSTGIRGSGAGLHPCEVCRVGASGRRRDAEQTVVDAVWSMTSHLLRCRTEPPGGTLKGAFAVDGRVRIAPGVEGVVNEQLAVRAVQHLPYDASVDFSGRRNGRQVQRYEEGAVRWLQKTNGGRRPSAPEMRQGNNRCGVASPARAAPRSTGTVICRWTARSADC